MSVLLLDTNIVSFALKNDTRAQEYAPLLSGMRLAISFVTVGELFEWAAVRQWGLPRRQRLEEKLTTYLIIPPDIELCRIWGTIRAEQQKKGLSVAAQDVWIAATARRYTLPLVTHNPNHFRSIDEVDVRSILPA